jgi:glutamyl-tRNA synthetase
MSGLDHAKVRTRFAPSPTGQLHIGGARTALYSYLWAKKNGGEFLLRIEDTDQTRYQADAEDNIFAGLRWLGLDWTDAVVHQSTRTAIYRQAAEQLLTTHQAYYCFCTAERLEMMRDIQRKKKRAPKYDKTCLALTPAMVAAKLAAHEAHVVRLNIPETGAVRFTDLVRGEIEFKCEELDDQILLKSDNFPTYHLANVVDDHDAGISHVIRGEEWIPSTPKHILLYQAFGWQPPVFAHLSLFIKKGGGKLSKREGATSLLEYKRLGYLPEAVVNFIAFLGWNPKTEQEFFTMAELIAAFGLTQVNTANPIFDTEKLDWFNGQYLRKLPLERLVELCRPYLPTAADGYLTAIVRLEQDRLKKYSDITELTDYFFVGQLQYDPSLLIWKKSTAAQTKAVLEQLVEKLGRTMNWSEAELEAELLAWIKQLGLGNGEVLWPLRAALTGKKASPSPFAVAAVLGQDRSLSRIQRAISLL